MAAGLVAMAARSSPDWEDGAGVAAQAQALRARVTPLALADSEAYADVLTALASEDERSDLASALRRASELPLAIVEAAADTATLAAYASSRCEAAVRGEALVAVALAEAAARAGARLVEINLAAASHDPHLERARRAVEEASAALHRSRSEG